MKDITLFLTEQLNLNEANETIKDEKSFREYAEAKLKEIHGDDYNEAEAKEMIDGILSDNKELVEKVELLCATLNRSFSNYVESLLKQEIEKWEKGE